MGCKKQDALLFKKRKGRLACSLLNNNDHIFCTPYFEPNFFQGHKPTHVFKTRKVGAD